MKNEEIHALLEEEIAIAEGSQHGDLMTHRDKALKYFKGETKGDDIAGRSKAQSMDTANMIESALAEMCDVFDGASVGLFDADSEEDEDQAKLESDFVEYMIERNGGYITKAEAIKDALMMRNGFIKIFVDEETIKESTPFEGSEPELSALVMQLTQQGWQVDIGEVSEGEGDQLKTSLTAERTNRELKICAVAPEQIRYSPEHDSSNIEGIRFFSEEDLITRADLERMYPDKSFNDVPATESSQDDTAAQRRRDHSSPENLTSPQRDLDLIKTHWCYIRLGELGELHKVHWLPDADKKLAIIDKEKVPFIPYATGTPFLFPHRVTGLSYTDKLAPIEDQKRFSLRQMLDNMNHMNNIRKKARKGAVEKKSLVNSRPGGVIWCDDPTTDVLDEQKQSIIADSVGALEYLDKMRTEAGGASLDVLDPNFQLAASGNVGDQGVMRQLDAKEKLVGMIAKNLGETLIKQMYLITHKTLRMYFDEEMSAKLNGQWSQTNPSQWPERKNVSIHIGMTGAQRMQKIATLDAVMANQAQLMQGGFDGVMVTTRDMYSAFRDWMQASNLDFPEKYATDPSSEEGQQAAEQKMQQHQEQQAKMEELQMGLVNVQNQLEKYKIDKDAQMKSLSEQVKLAIEEMKIIGSATKEFELARINAIESGNQESDQTPPN